MVKVLISDAMDEKSVEKMREKGLEVDYSPGMSEDELLSAVSDVDALVVRSATKVTPVVFDAATKLKLVVRGGVGLDNIDLGYAEEKGVAVRNTPGASSVAVAELVFGLLLAIQRKIPEAWSSMKMGKWEKKKFKGAELYRKTIGLVGCGRIGVEVARRAAGFALKVLVYDPFIDSLPEDIDAELVDLETLLAKSDFISIHTPLTEQTKHLISLETMEKMKKGVVIINCARGPVVKESDMIVALDQGIVAAYGVDVYEKEPTDNETLVKHPRVYPTPHIGASSSEGQARVGDEVIDVVCGFFEV